ncbi:MAG TPA: methyltransferase domain-containing protein [Candidatus Polarisedimenticolia bacterium]|nr:methyltransferase domain-containing protein [Candidatus Polarisedimenticolia bacterium]
MDPQSIRGRHAEVVAKSGAWTAHNIQIAPGVFTMEDGPVGDDERIRRITQLVSDLGGVPWERMRLLDLASLEGLYGLEFALRGAEVLSVEGRDDNLAKAEFARDCLGLTRFTTRRGDVREVSVERDGRFDVVLCLGILYHLESPSLFDFIMRLGEMTTRLLVVDTHIALRPKAIVRWGGAEWSGRHFLEHAAGSTVEEVRSRRWAALDNPTAFWLTEASLLRLLQRAGFTSIYLCKAPDTPGQKEDRVTLVAIKGTPAEVRSNPWPNRLEPGAFAERVERPHPTWRGIAHDLLYKMKLRGAAARLLRPSNRG